MQLSGPAAGSLSSDLNSGSHTPSMAAAAARHAVAAHTAPAAAAHTNAAAAAAEGELSAQTNEPMHWPEVPALAAAAAAGGDLGQQTVEIMHWPDVPALAAGAAAEGRLGEGAQTNTPMHWLPTAEAPPDTAAAAAAAEGELGVQTNEPMHWLPPFDPACQASGAIRERIVCPQLDCRLDQTCDVHDPTCCAYVNHQMLKFFDRFMSLKCLQDEWVVLYGTLLGALRDQTILPHTEDLDIGITPLGVQFLELNATRQELWKYGYAFWHHANRNVWKLCPHAHHPAPEIQALMMRDEPRAKWRERQGLPNTAFMDAWLMWQVPDEVTTCTTSAGIDISEALSVPWDAHTPPYDGITTTCEQVANSRMLHGLRAANSKEPWQVSPWEVSGATIAIALALEHACDELSSTGLKPMEEILLGRYSARGCTGIFLSVFPGASSCTAVQHVQQ